MVPRTTRVSSKSLCVCTYEWSFKRFSVDQPKPFTSFILCGFLVSPAVGGVLLSSSLSFSLLFFHCSSSLCWNLFLFLLDAARQRQHSTALTITVIIYTIMTTGRRTTCNLLFSNRLHEESITKIPFKTVKRRHKQPANLSAKYTANCLKSRSRNKDKKPTGILQTVQTKSKATTVRVTVTAGGHRGTSTSVPSVSKTPAHHRRQPSTPPFVATNGHQVDFHVSAPLCPHRRRRHRSTQPIVTTIAQI